MLQSILTMKQSIWTDLQVLSPPTRIRKSGFYMLSECSHVCLCASQANEHFKGNHSYSVFNVRPSEIGAPK
jgi:hypothetical protein